MACPFTRASSQQQFPNGSGKKPEFRSRQSSFHISANEEEDGDKNTLTLKHLSEALQLLTAPSVSRYEHYIFPYIKYYGDIKYNNRIILLPNAS